MTETLQPVVAPNPRIVAAESVMLDMPQVECPVTHRFTKGMYIREIFMPAGAWVASKIHKTEHPFTIMKGRVEVYNAIEGEEIQELAAPHIGITKPGTHRMLHILEDTIWITFHPNPTDETSLKLLEEMIIEPHEIPCLGSPQPLP